MTLPSRNRPVTLFPSPEWPLLPDPEGPRFYANVDNRLEVIAQDGSTHEVALAVPTAWFTLARDVLNVTREESVSLAIEYHTRWFIFSALTDTNRLFDLWAYTAGNLPSWLSEEPYRLGGAASAYRQSTRK